jgi:hypothetical protein
VCAVFLLQQFFFCFPLSNDVCERYEQSVFFSSFLYFFLFHFPSCFSFIDFLLCGCSQGISGPAAWLGYVRPRLRHSDRHQLPAERRPEPDKVFILARFDVGNEEKFFFFAQFFFLLFADVTFTRFLHSFPALVGVWPLKTQYC